MVRSLHNTALEVVLQLLTLFWIFLIQFKLGMDKKLFTYAIFTDLRNAFDTVNHDILDLNIT